MDPIRGLKERDMNETEYYREWPKQKQPGNISGENEKTLAERSGI